MIPLLISLVFLGRDQMLHH